MGDHDDVMTYVPWGPVALWGPTETAIEEIGEGLAPQAGDIRFLLETANRHLRRKVGPEDIVSLRCGIRALAVDRDYALHALSAGTVATQHRPPGKGPALDHGLWRQIDRLARTRRQDRA